jgi:hypothetical protein
VARQLLVFQQELSAEDLKLIDYVANYRHKFAARMFLFFSPSFSSGNFFKDLCVRYRILMNGL